MFVCCNLGKTKYLLAAAEPHTVGHFFIFQMNILYHNVNVHYGRNFCAALSGFLKVF